MWKILSDLFPFFKTMGKWIYTLYSFEHPVISVFSWFTTAYGVLMFIKKKIFKP